MEKLDYSNLYKTYSTLDRNPAINPITSFIMLIYGYTLKIYSRRELKITYQHNIDFV